MYISPVKRKKKKKFSYVNKDVWKNREPNLFEGGEPSRTSGSSQLT